MKLSEKVTEQEKEKGMVRVQESNLLVQWLGNQ
jgi:hypothetical protein